MNFRERWYAEHNLPYEPAKLDCPAPWQGIGGSAGGIKPPEKKLKPPVRSYHEPREREPGEDEEFNLATQA